MGNLAGKVAIVTGAASGIGRDGDVQSMEVAVWERTRAVNLRGTMLGCKFAVPRLLERGWRTPRPTPTSWRPTREATGGRGREHSGRGGGR